MQNDNTDPKQIIKNEYKKIEGDFKFSIYQALFYFSPIPALITTMWTNLPILVTLSIVYLAVVLILFIYKVLLPKFTHPSHFETLSLESGEVNISKEPITPNKERKKLETVTSVLRPNLVTKLVIDLANSKKVDFHIEIENKGQVPAKNIRAGFYSKGFMEFEQTPYMTRVLNPGATVSISTTPSVIKPKQMTSLVVKVLYAVEVDGVQKEFAQNLRFLLHPSDLKIQTINPEASNDEEISNSPLQEALMNVVTQFAMPEGTIQFLLPELGQDGIPQVIILSNEFRSFSFDAVTRAVSFKFKSDSAELISLDLPLLKSKDERRLHLIILLWKYPETGTLVLDNAEKKYSKE